ncbi:hypothetical protein CLOSTASPAR_06690 [[Clostridium] asparagiforme DSM 15981]|uniref:Uncharacterized protein n=1 Tax=[Clostridium] asparagiforme DSM 15981 TaxID=518636 RepID=C0DBN4_9FIRM|nr:hypothetical protein CLOSTASPAR_06690 [[Clostridium] asparagiforme DSM 15981]
MRAWFPYFVNLKCSNSRPGCRGGFRSGILLSALGRGGLPLAAFL